MGNRKVTWVKFLMIVLVVTGSLTNVVLVTASGSDYLLLLDLLDAARAWSTVDYLASDKFEGRKTGAQGSDLASQYIADHFNSIGLKPAGDGGTYRSKFSVPVWDLSRMPMVTLVDANGNALQSFQYRKDFYVRPGSTGGNYTTEIVFVGYGITAADLGYDDYAGISASGKIVMAIIGTPSSAKFEKGDYGTWYWKANNAQSRGAVAIILVDDPVRPTPHYVDRWSGYWTQYAQLTILRAGAELTSVLLQGTNRTLASIQETINHGLKPQSFPLNRRLTISVQVSYTQNASGYNVLGFIPGSDPVASKKVVIIGAHYDHGGKEVDGSILRGANDDASGTAVIMEIARVFSIAARPKMSILFAAWAGEEEGLFGSLWYAGHPYFPIKDTVAYLNLDMVGYGQQLLGEVSETHKSLHNVMIESAQELGISVEVEPYSGGSDHTAFEENGVQNLMFIYWPSDINDYYHTSADMANLVSKKNLLETARLTALIALKLSEATVAPVITTTRGTESETTTQSAFGGFDMKVYAIFGVVLVTIVVGTLLYFRRKK